MVLTVGLGLLAAGCTPGVRWELRTFNDAHALAQQQGKLTFVYLRNWYMVECTNFEEQVLKDVEVLDETADLVCVPLDFDRDKALAQKWRLRAPPALVVVAPGGEVLVRDDAPITRAELLAGLRAAKRKHAQGASAAERR